MAALRPWKCASKYAFQSVSSTQVWSSRLQMLVGPPGCTCWFSPDDHQGQRAFDFPTVPEGSATGRSWAGFGFTPPRPGWVSSEGWLMVLLVVLSGLECLQTAPSSLWCLCVFVNEGILEPGWDIAFSWVDSASSPPSAPKQPPHPNQPRRASGLSSSLDCGTSKTSPKTLHQPEQTPEFNFELYFEVNVKIKVKLGYEVKMKQTIKYVFKSLSPIETLLWMICWFIFSSFHCFWILNLVYFMWKQTKTGHIKLASLHHTRSRPLTSANPLICSLKYRSSFQNAKIFQTTLWPMSFCSCTIP